MKRINELTFELNEEQYHLSYYEKPILLKTGLIQKVKPVLREYIEKENLPIQLVNKNGNEEVPWTLARKILEYFSENLTKDSVNNHLNLHKNEKVENKKNKPIQNVFEKQELKISEKFKVVMICASEKKPGGELIFNEQIVKFYAQSNIANNEFLPDNQIPNMEMTWRDFVLANQNQNIIPYKAYELYKSNEYCHLKNTFGNRFFILSAGWGLVRADFRLPKYDITFSNSSKINKENKRAYNQPGYFDFNHLEDINDNEDIIYIGGKDYLDLFYALTQNLSNRKIIYWKAKDIPMPQVNLESFIFRYYEIRKNQNWYYDLAKKIANGIIP